MPFTIQCPNPACNARSAAADSFSGKSVRCKKCGKPFVANPTLDGRTNDTKYGTTASDAAVFPSLPIEFGRYRVLKLLGQDGMGAVYLAEDSQLERQVALKIPFFDTAQSSKRVERFVREAKSAARLHHPNICTVFDAGQIDGKPFITMAFIDGTTLDRQLDSDVLMPQRRAAEIACKIATALGHAHRKGTVHRDLKPANVMIDSGGEPVVMDFGLAKRAAHMEADEGKLTRPGAIVGTPSYMSPEQVKGEGQVVGPATDIYSLGVILFEMLTGKTPYAGSLVEVMGQILAAPLPPVREFRPDVDAQLEAICQKAMAKDTSARFGSMEEFAEALGHYLRPSPNRPAPHATVPKPTALNPSHSPMPHALNPQPINAASPFEHFSPPADVPGTPEALVVTRPKYRRNRLWNHPISLLGMAGLALAGLWAYSPLRTREGIPVPAVNEPKSTVNADVVKAGAAGETAKDPAERIEEFDYFIESQKRRGFRRVLEVDIGGGQKMEFVRIPKGTFSMGAPDGEPMMEDNEKPQHYVEISRDFYLGKYEVTQAQYRATMGENPSRFQGDRLPVENVNWNEAGKFCEALSKKIKRKASLPTEAQWEYACRAGTTTPFSFGSKLNGVSANCDGTKPYGLNVSGTDLGKTTLVGSYPPNPWGLYDMHGNVWEFCRNYFAPYDKSQVRDPFQPTPQRDAYRVLRGGSWTSFAKSCRSANRIWHHPDLRFDFAGFRVCLAIEEGPVE